MEPRSLQEYEQSLEIPREGAVPALADEEIDRLTRTVFAPPASEGIRSDLLFVFGTVQGDWDRLARLILDGYVSYAVLAGLIGPRYYETGEPIAETMRAHFLQRGVPEGLLRLQRESRHTLEDVELSLPHLEGVRSLHFFAKSHHSGRCLLTLRRFFPDADLFPVTLPARYGDIVVTPDSWMDTEVGRARVWGEWVRIRTYSARGDIAMPSL